MSATPEMARAAGASKEVTSRERVVIGAVGAATPLLANLLVMEHEALAEAFTRGTPWVLVGYTLKLLILVLIGGFVVYLHSDETNRLKIFQLGLGAPALILALANGSQLNAQVVTATYSGTVTDVSGAVVPDASVTITKIGTQDLRTQTTGQAGEFQFENLDAARYTVRVQASGIGVAERSIELGAGQTATGSYVLTALKKFSLPQESVFDQVFRGLKGVRTEKRWFVIVKRHKRLRNAQRHAEEINEQNLGVSAEVYEPYGTIREVGKGDSAVGTPMYSVVIGAQLTYREAQELRQKAITAGLPDTTLWTPPANKAG